MSDAPAADGVDPAAAQSPLRSAIIDTVLPRLPAGGTVRIEDARWRRRLDAGGFFTRDLTAPGLTDAGLLIGDELARAGEHAESLLADVVSGIRPGGRLAVTFSNALMQKLDPAPAAQGRAWRPADVTPFLGSRGVRLEALWGPGASARIAGLPPAFDADADKEASLLGAARTLLAVARTPISETDRSDVFFATLPSKTVAAATLTRRDHDGKLLVVHDTFKSRWTIPGGIVDADEDPEHAAVRETREESGVDVGTTGLLGVFHGLRPDRLVFVFGAKPIAARTGQSMPDDAPTPIHTHEVDAAEWVTAEEALRRVAPHTAEQISRGLYQPGGVWRQY